VENKLENVFEKIEKAAKKYGGKYMEGEVSAFLTFFLMKRGEKRIIISFQYFRKFY